MRFLPGLPPPASSLMLCTRPLANTGTARNKPHLHLQAIACAVPSVWDPISPQPHCLATPYSCFCSYRQPTLSPSPKFIKHLPIASPGPSGPHHSLSFFFFLICHLAWTFSLPPPDCQRLQGRTVVDYGWIPDAQNQVWHTGHTDKKWPPNILGAVLGIPRVWGRLCPRRPL